MRDLYRHFPFTWIARAGAPRITRGEQTEILRCPHATDCEVVARMPDRCYGINVVDRVVVRAMWLDNMSGVLYLRFAKLSQASQSESWGGQYGQGMEIDRIEGLPTLFEVLQTYLAYAGRGEAPRNQHSNA